MDGIVTILLFIVLIVVSSVRKSRLMKRMEGQERKAAAVPEAEEYTPMEYPHEDEVKTISTEKHREEYSVPTTYKEEAESGRAVVMPDEPAAMSVDAVHLSASTQSDNVETSSDFEFDLRRAVIESEILAPKFKQY